MTRYDHIVTMSRTTEKTVKVAELKAQLSAYLRAARQGHAVTVCDRDTPVARLVPYGTTAAALPSKPPTRTWGEMHLPGPIGRRVDSLAVLLEDRQTSR
jgi:prevent-host-death family protein